MKRILSMLIVVTLLFSIAVTTTATAQDATKVFLDGKMITFDVQPQIFFGRTLVPMRKIFEELGATVNWDAATQTITAIKDDTAIVMQVGNYSFSVNGKVSKLDVIPIVIDGRTLVPVRAIAESFGVEVFWYGDISTVAIYTDEDLIEQKCLYTLSGTLCLIDANFEEYYLALGWSYDVNKVSTTLYSPDGTSKTVFIADVQNELANGWYEYPVITVYATDGRSMVIAKSEELAYQNVGWYSASTLQQMELSANQSQLPLIAYDTSQIGSVTGTITWQYNDVVGTKADVDASVILIQTNHIPLESDLNAFALGFKGNDSTIHCTKVDGMGNYYFDYVPAGKYYLIVISKNTMCSPQKAEMNINSAKSYLNGKISPQAMEFLELTLKLNSFEIVPLEVNQDRLTRFSHDFGNTYF